MKYLLVTSLILLGGISSQACQFPDFTGYYKMIDKEGNLLTDEVFRMEQYACQALEWQGYVVINNQKKVTQEGWIELGEYLEKNGNNVTLRKVYWSVDKTLIQKYTPLNGKRVEDFVGGKKIAFDYKVDIFIAREKNMYTYEIFYQRKEKGKDSEDDTQVLSVLRIYKKI